MADFASMLKYLREREHLSQRELASKLQMSPSAIGMYESGKRHPKYEDEELIADFFNVDLNTLRGRRIYEDDPAYEKIIKAYVEGSRTKEFIDLFMNVDPALQEYVVNVLKAAQQKP